MLILSVIAIVSFLAAAFYLLESYNFNRQRR